MSDDEFGDLPEALRTVPAGWATANRAALEGVMPTVYDELRRMARRQLRRERAAHTLQTTALVHEVYLRLIEQRNLRPEDRAHFVAMAARLMRFILVDHARRRQAVKHGGAVHHVTLDEAVLVSDQGLGGFLDLDAALERLARVDARKVQVAELRLFGGLTADEIADAVGVSAITVKRDWQFARAWLARELGGAA